LIFFPLLYTICEWSMSLVEAVGNEGYFSETCSGLDQYDHLSSSNRDEYFHYNIYGSFGSIAFQQLSCLYERCHIGRFLTSICEVSDSFEA
jgi:hypothetical protein